MPPPAAIIVPVQGTLSINHGDGFVAVNRSVAATAGDAAMVSANGSATIVSPDGCKIPPRGRSLNNSTFKITAENDDQHL
jgi:hypothetical protein